MADTDLDGNVVAPLSSLCDEPLPVNLTRSQCCCNMGTHYGSDCETCPTREDCKYKLLQFQWKFSYPDALT